MTQPAKTPEIAHPDPAVENAQLIFREVWASLEATFGHQNLRFPKEIIWLNGAPGSGKGTNTPFILRERSITAQPVVTSELLNTPEAQKIKDAGNLISDPVVVRLLFAKLLDAQYLNGVIVDGFPRTLKQAAALDALLASQGRQIDAVIELKVNDAVLIDRISGRYMCANCGASYHDTNCKPKVAGKCDRCGGHDFVRRADDNVETVKNRLMAYYRETAPLIGYYFAKGKLKAVDGLAPISDVSKQIEAILAGCRSP